MDSTEASAPLLESYVDRRQQTGVDPPSGALDMVGQDPAVAGDIA